MKDLTEKQSEKLIRTISMGKWRFVVLYGILFWGLISALLARILSILFDYLWSYKEAPFVDQFISQETLVAFIAFPIVGIGWGLVMWKYIQSAAKKHDLLH